MPCRRYRLLGRLFLGLRGVKRISLLFPTGRRQAICGLLRCTMRSPGPMPLSEPHERELLHLRDIALRGYRRADGLFDIEAHLTDTKTYGFPSEDRGFVR